MPVTCSSRLQSSLSLSLSLEEHTRLIFTFFRSHLHPRFVCFTCSQLNRVPADGGRESADLACPRERETGRVREERKRQTTLEEQLHLFIHVSCLLLHMKGSQCLSQQSHGAGMRFHESRAAACIRSARVRSREEMQSAQRLLCPSHQLLLVPPDRSVPHAVGAEVLARLPERTDTVLAIVLQVRDVRPD